jgi:hypothetical protein
MSIQVRDNIYSDIESQFPNVYRENSEFFIAFVEAYYRYLDQKNDRDIPKLRDIDTTLPAFFVYYKKKYLADLPLDSTINVPFIVKHINDLYTRKGTKESLELLFKMFFNEDITVTYPGGSVLKPSNSRWGGESFLEMKTVFSEDGYPIQRGNSIKGDLSSAEAFVDDIVFVNFSGALTPILYMSNLKGTFVGDDSLEVISATNDGTETIINVGKLISGSVSDVEISKAVRLPEQKPGDTVDIISKKSGTGAKGIITSASKTQVGSIDYEIIDGGYGYIQPNTNDFSSQQTLVSNHVIVLSGDNPHPTLEPGDTIVFPGSTVDYNGRDEANATQYSVNGSAIVTEYRHPLLFIKTETSKEDLFDVFSEYYFGPAIYPSNLLVSDEYPYEGLSNGDPHPLAGQPSGENVARNLIYDNFVNTMYIRAGSEQLLKYLTESQRKYYSQFMSQIEPIDKYGGNFYNVLLGSGDFNDPTAKASTFNVSEVQFFIGYQNSINNGIDDVDLYSQPTDYDNWLGTTSINQSSEGEINLDLLATEVADRLPTISPFVTQAVLSQGIKSGRLDKLIDGQLYTLTHRGKILTDDDFAKIGCNTPIVGEDFVFTSANLLNLSRGGEPYKLDKYDAIFTPHKQVIAKFLKFFNALGLYNQITIGSTLDTPPNFPDTVTEFYPANDEDGNAIAIGEPHPQAGQPDYGFYNQYIVPVENLVPGRRYYIRDIGTTSFADWNLLGAQLDTRTTPNEVFDKELSTRPISPLQEYMITDLGDTTKSQWEQIGWVANSDGHGDEPAQGDKFIAPDFVYSNYTIEIDSIVSNAYVIGPGSTDSTGAITGQDRQIQIDVGDTVTFNNDVHETHPVQILSQFEAVETISDISDPSATDTTGDSDFIISGHDFASGDEVTVSFGSGTYADLETNKTYYVKRVSSSNFELYTQQRNAAGNFFDQYQVVINPANLTASQNFVADTALSTITAQDTNGTYSCDPTTLKVGDRITVSGTFGGAPGSITGYSDSTTYAVSSIVAGASPNVTQFQIETLDGNSVTTTTGVVSGATFTPQIFIPTSVTFTRASVVETYGVTGAGTNTVSFTPPTNNDYYYESINDSDLRGTIVVNNKTTTNDMPDVSSTGKVADLNQLREFAYITTSETGDTFVATALADGVTVSGTGLCVDHANVLTASKFSGFGAYTDPLKDASGQTLNVLPSDLQATSFLGLINGDYFNPIECQTIGPYNASSSFDVTQVSDTEVVSITPDIIGDHFQEQLEPRYFLTGLTVNTTTGLFTHDEQIIPIERYQWVEGPTPLGNIVNGEDYYLKPLSSTTFELYANRAGDPPYTYSNKVIPSNNNVDGHAIRLPVPSLLDPQNFDSIYNMSGTIGVESLSTTYQDAFEEKLITIGSITDILEDRPGTNYQNDVGVRVVNEQIAQYDLRDLIITFDNAPFSLQAGDIVIQKIRSPYEGPESDTEADYIKGALTSDVTNGALFDRSIDVNGMKIVLADATLIDASGLTNAVTDEFGKKVARVVSLLTDKRGAGIDESAQRKMIKILNGKGETDDGKKRIAQRVAYGSAGSYTPNFITNPAAYSGYTSFLNSHNVNDTIFFEATNRPSSGFGVESMTGTWSTIPGRANVTTGTGINVESVLNGTGSNICYLNVDNTVQGKSYTINITSTADSSHIFNLAVYDGVNPSNPDETILTQTVAVDSTQSFNFTALSSNTFIVLLAGSSQNTTIDATVSVREIIDGQYDVENVVENLLHTFHLYAVRGAVEGSETALNWKATTNPNWENTELHLAMKEAIDNDMFDPTSYAPNWFNDQAEAESAYKEYLYLLNWSMWAMSEFWVGSSKAPQWNDSMRTPLGIEENNPLGYELFNTYIAPVLSRPNFITLREMFQHSNGGVSGYVPTPVTSYLSAKEIQDLAVSSTEESIRAYKVSTGDNSNPPSYAESQTIFNLEAEQYDVKLKYLKRVGTEFYFRPMSFFGVQTDVPIFIRSEFRNILTARKDLESLPMGANAQILGAAEYSTGQLEGVKILHTGYKYEDGEEVDIINTNVNSPTYNQKVATGKIVSTGQGNTEGGWKDSSSFLNESSAVVHDNDYYQEFSYDISTMLDPEIYTPLVKDVVGVAGTKMFSTPLINSENSFENSIDVSLTGFQILSEPLEAQGTGFVGNATADLTGERLVTDPSGADELTAVTQDESEDIV